MATKQELLNELALLDLGTLEKLHKYSQLLLLPEEDLLVNVTMSQMVQKAHQLADAHFPEWTDRSKSDFGQYLVELIALFSEKDFWYLNAFASEAQLANTRVYSNAFVKAVTLGYEPRTCRGASADFLVSFAPGAEATYGPGELVLAQQNTGVQFSNDQVFTVTENSVQAALTLPLSEGTYQNEQVSFNGHNVVLTRKGIDLDTLTVKIDSVQWSRVNKFGLSGPSSKHFVVIPEENGAATLFFGEDGYGERPAIGAQIVMKYRTCAGTAGNVAVRLLGVNKSQSLRRPAAAVQITPSIGGQDPEPLSAIKYAAPLYFSTKKALINAVAVENFLSSLPTVKKAKASVFSNSVRFYVIPSDGTEADAAFLDGLEAGLFPLLQMGYSATGLPTRYVDCGPLTLTCYSLKGVSKATTESLVRQLVEDYTNPLVLSEFGRAFDLSELSLLLRSRVPGLQNVIFNQVAGGAARNLPVEPLEITRKLLPADLTVLVNVI